ncbi:MAG TPA: DMT family transporter [Candidatus Aphodousia gallistercoris]|nr:DMT family transporter [Candidatus Aphodousia gallistercoris]
MGNTRWIGHAMIIFTQVMLGINIPITRDLLLHFLSPLGYIGLRAGIAALFFWLIQCFAKKETIRRKDFLMILLGGFLGFVFSQYLTSLSLQYTTPVYFSLILALSPVVVMLLQAVVFGEKITKRKTIGSLLGILGAAILAIRAALESGAQGSNNLMDFYAERVLDLSSVVLFRNLGHGKNLDNPRLFYRSHGNRLYYHLLHYCSLHAYSDRDAHCQRNRRQHLHEPSTDCCFHYCHYYRHGRIFF